jgi:hypothetical protein
MGRLAYYFTRLVLVSGGSSTQRNGIDNQTKGRVEMGNFLDDIFALFALIAVLLGAIAFIILFILVLLGRKLYKMRKSTQEIDSLFSDESTDNDIGKP